MISSTQKFSRRKMRTRSKLAARRNGLPRLSVFRSNMHIHAQIIDDENRKTLAAASSVEKNSKLKSGGNVEAASVIGKMLAERAVSKGIKKVVFDRGGYIFHGRVKALAEAARENGLEF